MPQSDQPDHKRGTAKSEECTTRTNRSARRISEVREPRGPCLCLTGYHLISLIEWGGDKIVLSYSPSSDARFSLSGPVLRAASKSEGEDIESTSQKGLGASHTSGIGTWGGMASLPQLRTVRGAVTFCAVGSCSASSGGKRPGVGSNASWQPHKFNLPPAGSVSCAHVSVL
jgi:hypothetical protein